MGNPAPTWDQHQQQSTVWLGRNNCKQEPGEEVQGAWMSGMWQRVGDGLMEKSFALAQEQKEEDAGWQQSRKETGQQLICQALK